MTLSVDLVRARRRRRQAGRPLGHLRRIGVVVAAVLVVAVGALATLGAFAFDDLTGDLPQVSRIEGYFDPASGANRPTQYFDRSGQTALGESASSAPVSLHSPIVDPGLDFLIRATVAYFDPDFWGEEGSGSAAAFPPCPSLLL